MYTARTMANRANETSQLPICNLHFAICNRRPSRRGFTLVELLVVITIIGILAALITAAGAGALKRAQQARIKTEIDQISMGLQTFKDTYQSYPPNCQVDDTGPIDESQVLSDLKRAMKQAFPRHRESENLLRALAGLAATGADAANYQRLLPGGMSSGEALVFWLGGFSSDPKYPISGEGGPSYQVPSPNQATNNQLDAVESRKWVFPFEVARLQPRNTDNFFDSSQNRFVEYTITIPGQNNNNPQVRRINFWQYVPAKSEQPFLYFDTSRHAPGIPNGPNLIAAYDPPASSNLHVHAIKQRSESAGDAVQIQFANKDKFQILHAGVDDEWGDAEFEKMSVHVVGVNNADSYLLFPNGPFTGEIADTITNFSEGTLEASQP